MIEPTHDAKTVVKILRDRLDAVLNDYAGTAKNTETSNLIKQTDKWLEEHEST